MKAKQTIKNFIKYWDGFVKNWFLHKSRDNRLCAGAAAYLSTNKLDDDELPEPYLGDPHNAKFIIINLNPGASVKSSNSSGNCSMLYEESKFYRNYRDGKGAQIQELSNKQLTYSAFIKEFSALKESNRDTICGGHWWQGKGNGKGRFRWIESFYHLITPNASLNDSFRPDDVFALELCPFHSKSWDDTICSGHRVQKIIKKRIFIPAIAAAQCNNVPCIVCVGNTFNTIISNIFDKAKKIGEWPSPEQGGNICWPKSSNRPIKRKYCLYQILYKGFCSKFLVLSAEGSNKLPSAKFYEFEKKNIIPSILRTTKLSIL